MIFEDEEKEEPLVLTKEEPLVLTQELPSSKKAINKNMAWCDDSNNKKYNTEIKTTNKNLKEYLYRSDHKYDYLITISHNDKKIPYKGSAIFIHLEERF